MGRFVRTTALASLVLLLATATVLPRASEVLAGTPSAEPAASTAGSPGIEETAFAYVVQFYPLWFTYWQSRIVPENQLAGPERVSPIYKIVVAINVDTLYASSLVNLHEEPVVVTIPETSATYSILTLNAYGEIFHTNLVAGTPGTYLLTGPGWSGTAPAGTTQVPIPFDYSILIFRADRYSSSGENQVDEADTFRESLRLLPLSEYVTDPTGGATSIYPEFYFAEPYKRTADSLATYAPIRFLEMLQQAVGSSNTPPLSAYEQELSQRFDQLFGDGEGHLDPADELRFGAGTRRAHAAILERYHAHAGPTGWINFTNIGHWGPQVIERAAITEFIQYGNDHATAAYYHAFEDGHGIALDGSKAQEYVLHFPPGQVPEAKRFWSLTAYTPEDVELVWNLAQKYAVASYTPDLVQGADGSVTIHLSVDPPRHAPLANWLPVPAGPFNVMLRVYGPEGSVAAATYVPPGIVRTRGTLIPIR